MKPMWTKEQQRVIESRGSNLLVSAAAGSGKTAVLVERIIQIVLDENNPVDIDKLLVVTFTKAAASEMKERIEDAISKKIDENPEILSNLAMAYLNNAELDDANYYIQRAYELDPYDEITLLCKKEIEKYIN